MAPVPHDITPSRSMSAEDSHAATGTNNKRRRITLACDECRERKRKCDGVRPVCGACIRRSSPSCVWHTERNSKGWTDSYVEGLRSRIVELETVSEDRSNATNGNHLAAVPAPQRTVPSHRRPSIVVVESESGPSNAVSREPFHHDWTATILPNLNDASLSVDANVFHDPDQEYASEHSEEDVDAMGVVGPATGSSGDVRQPGYFGPSSTVSLLEKARGAMRRHSFRESVSSRPFAKSGPKVQPLAASMGSTSQSSTRSATSDLSMLGISVPIRAEADALLGNFWSSGHSLYPFIHRPSFEQRYLGIWSARGRSDPDESGRGYYSDLDDRSFHCMLNTVLALGALFSPDIQNGDRDEVSYSFFEKAKALLNLDHLFKGNVGLVQTLLLMGQYLQSTEMASSCWTIVGLAVRMAQGIGLHQESYSDKGRIHATKQDQLGIEMRRRTWTGCVLLDRILSLTYGRPLMIHPAPGQSRLVLPESVDDQYLTQYPEFPGSQPEALPSLVECYIQAIKLQDILGQVLASLYDGSVGENEPCDGVEYPTALPSASDRTKHPDWQVLLQTDSALERWHKELPPHLKMQTYNDLNLHAGPYDLERTLLYRRQATVLEARYLHVRLTALRPALSVVCDLARLPPVSNADWLSSSMRHDTMIKAANLCVSVAREQIQLVIGKIELQQDDLPAPWYNVFYVHSCAIVLLIGYLCTPNYVTCVDRRSIAEECNRCIAFLRGYQSRSRSARRCSRILDVIGWEIFSSSSGRGDDSQPSRSSNSHRTIDAIREAGNIIRERAPAAQTEQDPDLNFFNDTFAPDTLFDENVLDQGWLCNSADMDWLSVAPFLEGLTDEIG
ncbi:hypothetical protein LTS10_005857 [Elasticomyces elasticus]|nr:hypothetical protein LTS10_005857 [Elasticomyces elasticus]